MDFKEIIQKLKEGKKVKRPCWEEDSYWTLGKDEVIIWTGGTIAKIHLNQINANDWEIFKEEPKVVILDDNEISILNYAIKHPENWKKICEALDRNRGIKK